MSQSLSNDLSSLDLDSLSGQEIDQLLNTIFVSLENTDYKKLHRLFLKISSGAAGNAAKKKLILKIVENGWDTVRKIWTGDTKSGNEHALVVNFVLKLVSENPKEFREILELSLKSLKSLDENDHEDIEFYFMYFYIILTKYNGRLSIEQYEALIPTLLSFGSLSEDAVVASSSSATTASSLYRMILLRLSSLDSIVKTKNSNTPINDIIYDHFETYILLHGDDALKNPKDFLCLLKNYQLIIQVFPQEFTAMIFESEVFSMFLNNQIRSLVKSFQKDSSSVNYDLIIHILQVFDSISIYESCTTLIINNYLNLILEIARLPLSDTTSLLISLSSLIVVKCWNPLQQMSLADPKREKPSEPEFGLEEVFENFVDCLVEIKSTDLIAKYCIEGLAFLSLKVEFKRQIRKNHKLITELIVILEKEVKLVKSSLKEVVSNSQSNEVIYGILLTMSNIVTYNLKLSKEEESMEYLKHYSNANTIVNNDERIKNRKLGVQEKDVDEEITSFITFIQNNPNLEFLSLFTKIFKLMTTNIQNLVVRIIYNISLQKQFRVKLVKFGCMNALIEYLIEDDQSAKKLKAEEPYENYVRLYCLRALAKILISNNPNLVFNKYSALAVVSFLCELLDDGSFYVETTGGAVQQFIAKLVKPLDVLESLLSLTNLASIEDMKVKESITNKAWMYLDNLMLTTNELVQKSALELISNLIFCPVCTTKFFNPDNSESQKRLDILVKLTNSNNIDIQIISTTVIVNASEYEMVAEALSTNKSLFHRLVVVLSSVKDYTESEEKVTDLLLRVGYLILNIVEAGKQNIDLICQWKFEEGSLKSAIDSCLKIVSEEEVLAVFVEICTQLKFI